MERWTTLTVAPREWRLSEPNVILSPRASEVTCRHAKEPQRKGLSAGGSPQNRVIVVVLPSVVGFRKPL